MLLNNVHCTIQWIIIPTHKLYHFWSTGAVLIRFHAFYTSNSGSQLVWTMVHQAGICRHNHFTLYTVYIRTFCGLILAIICTYTLLDCISTEWSCWPDCVNIARSLIVADISSVKDFTLRVKELGTKARLYEPSLAKASGHLQRLGATNDKERWDKWTQIYICHLLYILR